MQIREIIYYIIPNCSEGRLNPWNWAKSETIKTIETID